MKHSNLYALLLAIFMIAPLSANDIYVTYERLTPSKDTYVQLNSGVTTVFGTTGTVYVKYNGTVDITAQRNGLYEFDFTPYLDKLSQIKSLTLNLGVRRYDITVANEPADLSLHVYKIPANAGFVIDESAANNTLYTAYQTVDENNFIELGSIAVPTDKANTTFMYRSISLDITDVLSSVSASNPTVSFCVKSSASRGQSANLSFESKESENEHLKSYLQIKLETTSAYAATVISPERDTHFQYNDAVSTVFGANDLLQLKGTSTSTSTRYGLIQFDFTSYSSLLNTAKAINLGLNTDFTGDNAGNDSTLLTIFGASGLTFTETMANTAVMNAYSDKASEIFLTNKTVSSSSSVPAKDYLFELDKTKLLSLVETSPVVTFVVKSVYSPGGFLRIASKEHATRTHPFIQILNSGIPTQLNPIDYSDDTLTEIRYYTLQGVEVQEPIRGNIYVVKKVYASQKSEITKSFIR